VNSGQVIMRALFYLELVGGLVLILFGVLFLLFLPLNFSELTTIVIFVGAGALLIRKAAQIRKDDKVRAEISKKPQKKGSKTKSGPKNL
jgi:hypothetical protein